MNPLSLLKAAASQSELGLNMAGTPQACRAAARVVEAATALYMAGRWFIPVEDANQPHPCPAEQQAHLWLELRDALGLAPGTATAAGVGAQCTHGCPRCDDAIECDCEPPLPMFGDLRPQCTVPPEGWRCTRGQGHSGPCAAVPNGADPRWRPGSEL